MTIHIDMDLGKTRRMWPNARKWLAAATATAALATGLGAVYKHQASNMYGGADASHFEDFAVFDIKDAFDIAFRARYNPDMDVIAEFQRLFKELDRYESDPKLSPCSAEELARLREYGQKHLDLISDERTDEKATYVPSFQVE